MPKIHRVRAGECIASIAFQHGLFPETVWQHDENAELRALRKDPSLLVAGDRVFIPDLRERWHSVSTDARHVFRRRGVPERISVQLLDAQDRPRAGVPFTLYVGSAVVTGESDSEGWVRAYVSPAATHATLELPDGETYTLAIGDLDPVETVRGLKQRLRALGYPCGNDASPELEDETRDAIDRFVRDVEGDGQGGGGGVRAGDESALPRVRELLVARTGS
jgi:hypothetical protein